MPIIILIIAALMSLILYPLSKKAEDNAIEKAFLEGWQKKKPKRPAINYSKVVFVLFVVGLILLMAAFVIAMVYPPLS
jgi:hypothetical protein